MPTVSVIIPAYNQADFLAQCIDSVLGQTHRECEVIVIDDGSSDNTPTIAARYHGDPRFHYFRQENAGVAAARNRGLRESTGEYISFLDSDDWFAADKVARQLAVLEANRGVGWVYCDFITVDAQGESVTGEPNLAQSRRQLSGDIFGSLLVGGYFPPHVVLIRRSVLAEVGDWDQEMGGYMDYDLWLRVAATGSKVAFIPEPLAWYRDHPSSMSKDPVLMRESRERSLRKIMRLFPERAAAGLDQLQQTLIEVFAANQWLDRQLKHAEARVTAQRESADAVTACVQLAVAWRSKLEAGVTLANLGQTKSAAKLMLDAVKAVEACRRPQIILEALLEVSSHLGRIDRSRARHVVGLALDFARRIDAQDELRRATNLHAELSQPLAGKAAPRATDTAGELP